MKKIFITLFLMVIVNLPAHAGFSLGQTRVVYDEKNKQATLRLINSGDDSHFLVQSWIEDANNKPIEDFVISPPIFKFYPNSENTLIVKSLNDSFSTDRESLYYLNVKALPAVDSSIKNKVSFATKNVIKLIYRPVGLDLNGAMKAPKDLVIAKDGDTVIISNPTPYIINFGYFYVNNKEQKVSYALPFSTQKITAASAGVPKSVKYNTINDFGGASDYTNLTI